MVLGVGLVAVGGRQGGPTAVSGARGPSSVGSTVVGESTSTSTVVSTATALDETGRAAPAAPLPGVVPDPSDLLVLVDHHRYLPPAWQPAELVAPDVAFTFDGEHPKRLMQPEAAEAFERLVEAAGQDGVVVLGVSAFRSEQTQHDLYALNVARHGEGADSISARPGHSEHQTGLAIDVAGADRSCLVSACFAGTVEARWLERHAAHFGFVVRYPAGKEAVTGYQHEPWHLRYVGPSAATEIAEQGITLDEYLGAA